jgi:hypothetical protein
MRQCNSCHTEFQDWVTSCLICSGQLTARPVLKSEYSPFEASEEDFEHKDLKSSEMRELQGTGR